MKLFSLFRQKTPPPSSPTPAPVSSDSSLQPITLRTLLIVFNPTVEPTTGKKLLEFMHWNKVEDLTAGYISDIQQASGGLVQHQIVERIDVDAFPAKVDGYVYDARTFLNVLRDPARRYMPQEVDYYAIIKQFNILQRVANNEIDEVWTFNFPHAGFYESIMGGPGAFWCNAPPLQQTEASKRRFVIMGFSFERGVGEMLEDMGHRAESIMAKVFERTQGDDNLWQRFIR